MKEKDTWNLADNKVNSGYMDYSEDDIKIFIQKVKDDIDSYADQTARTHQQKFNEGYLTARHEIKTILDKRAGDL